MSKIFSFNTCSTLLRSLGIQRKWNGKHIYDPVNMCMWSLLCTHSLLWWKYRFNFIGGISLLFLRLTGLQTIRSDGTSLLCRIPEEPILAGRIRFVIDRSWSDTYYSVKSTQESHYNSFPPHGPRLTPIGSGRFWRWDIGTWCWHHFSQGWCYCSELESLHSPTAGHPIICPVAET